VGIKDNYATKKWLFDLNYLVYPESLQYSYSAQIVVSVAVTRYVIIAQFSCRF